MTIDIRPPRKAKAAFVKPAPFLRGCARCGTEFFATEGGAPERGSWHDCRWYCSLECLGSFRSVPKENT